jgi:hypothetical protein
MSRGALLPKRAKGARRVCIGGCSPHLTGRSGLDSPQGETRYRFRLAPPTPGTDAARERRASASSGARKYVREGVAITAANLVDDGRRGGHLSETEERELRRRAAQYTRPHREVIRAKVGLLAAEGHSDCEIPRRLDCTDKTAGMSDPLAHLWRMDSSSHAPDTTRLCTARARREAYPNGGTRMGRGGQRRYRPRFTGAGMRDVASAAAGWWVGGASHCVVRGGYWDGMRWRLAARSSIARLYRTSEAARPHHETDFRRSAA